MGIVVHALQCLFGRFASSNAAVAWQLGGFRFELYALDLFVDGVLQSRAYTVYTLPGGEGTVAREPNRVTVSFGQVVVGVRVGFNEIARPEQAARVGYTMNVVISTPIADPTSPELTGLCAVDTDKETFDEAPVLQVDETLFQVDASLRPLLGQCGFDEPAKPPICPNPGINDCCPAFDTIDEANALCAFLACSPVEQKYCRYDVRARARRAGVPITKRARSGRARRRVALIGSCRLRPAFAPLNIPRVARLRSAA
jgi:hypothetical protein